METQQKEINMTDFYNIKMLDIQGSEVNFADYQGKACLIVNVASRWGLTSQYAGLRTLQEQFADHPFEVLAFPCNQFGAQEPGSNEEVLEFAQTKYNVNFQIFSKIEVNGANACELYQFLKSEKTDEEGNADIPWNFAKFLVNKDGEVVGRFSPKTAPEELTETILGSF